MNRGAFEHPPFAAYALLDSGDGEKLERFGSHVLRRPDPQALWRPRLDAAAWRAAQLTFVRESDRGGRWQAHRDAPATLRAAEPRWEIDVAGCRIELRPTPFKHVGLFPEQASNWSWVEARRDRLGERPRLLNLFGYTGVASVLALRAGYAVTHVDASRLSLTWARENARLSGCEPDALRVVLEDAVRFAQRELRRSARYEGILLDPPHYGRGPKGEKWQFERAIAPLLETCAGLLAERAFLVLSTYAIGTSPLALANLLAPFEGGELEFGELALPEESGDRFLPAGFCARWWR